MSSRDPQVGSDPPFRNHWCRRHVRMYIRRLASELAKRSWAEAAGGRLLSLSGEEERIDGNNHTIDSAGCGSDNQQAHAG
ncbi:hypothetical protein J4Q44_G00001170 [Coregonus suidteri]|uniref:Uncharacterized protein n=1 Tax=Coregonus suidteri TaxID=861788 RepID=A0AAN8ME31_9TELE